MLSSLYADFARTRFRASMYPHVPLMDVTHVCTHARMHVCTHANETYRSPVYGDPGPFLPLSERRRATSCTGSMHVQKVHPRRDRTTATAKRNGSHLFLFFFFPRKHDARCKMRRVRLAVVIIARGVRHYCPLFNGIFNFPIDTLWRHK